MHTHVCVCDDGASESDGNLALREKEIEEEEEEGGGNFRAEEKWVRPENKREDKRKKSRDYVTLFF